VTPGGYAWWYLDAFSDDGRYGITIIAFVGSVFSPYYAWAGRRDPLNHCAINVALYGRGASRWSMTERGRGALSRKPHEFSLGRSTLAWDGSKLFAEIDERGAPIPRPLRGRVWLEPQAWNRQSFTLSESGSHVWRPVAPFARALVAFSEPNISWSGDAYLDFNQGAAPLEADFRYWTWSRARTRTGAAILYEAERRAAPPLSLSLRFGPDGAAREGALPPRAALAPGLWRVKRETRSDTDARVTAGFEDSPFYTRSRIAHRLDGEDTTSMHEALDCDRFAHPLVRAMLPFRMPRAFGGGRG